MQCLSKEMGTYNGTVDLKQKICVSQTLECLNQRHTFFKKGLGSWSWFSDDCLE